MKKLVLGVLLAAVASSTGCIITSGHSDSVVSVDWSFAHLSGSGPVGCAHSDDIAVVMSQPWDPDAQLEIGSPLMDPFDCAAGGADITLPDDTYLIWVEIQSVSGQIIGRSDQFVVDTSLGDHAIQPFIYDDGGFFTFSWDLVNKATNARLSCKSAGITGNGSVEIISTSIADMSYFKDDKFTCEDHFGTTDPLKPGSYTIAVDAEEANLGVGDTTTLTNKLIVANQITDLGNIKIKIP
jgi:hypothetical protein